MAEASTRSPALKLVLIGRNLDRGQLRAQLEACLAPVPSSVALR